MKIKKEKREERGEREKKSGKYDRREEVKGKIKEQVWRKGKVLMNLQVKYG